MEYQQALAVTTEVFRLYELHGAADYIGEPVSQLEHMCQAAQLAELAGCRDEVVLAAFFHDIGHLCAANAASMNGYGAVDHEGLGAAYLEEKGFPSSLAQLVGSHVEAKRYLTYRFPSYYEQLSVASRETLALQGGPMTAGEALVFESHPLYTDMVLLREWDDQAKETDIPLPDLARYKEMAIRVLTQK